MVWRRLLVPDTYTLRELHGVIQVAMGWEGTRTGQHRALPNTPAALARFAASLPPGCLVVCEATGGHEAALLAACLDAGIPVHRADARKVRAFARSFGT